MKLQSKTFVRSTSFLLHGLLFMAFFWLYSCQYDEIVDTDYPDGKIYIPVAYNGPVYRIDEITQPAQAVPTPGSAYRYQANKETNTFTIPLGIYRSGINPGGAVTVSIAKDPSVVSLLKENADLGDDVLLLPEGKYTIAESVRMEDGQREASFDLVVDFSFLRNQTPDKYAVGITISCPEQEVNAGLHTIAVLIDTKMMLPVPFFAFSANPTNKAEINFLNSSQFALSYSWDFGDGSSASKESDPTHVYPSLDEDREYTVKLSAEGLYGDITTYEGVVKVVKKN